MKEATQKPVITLTLGKRLQWSRSFDIKTARCGGGDGGGVFWTRIFYDAKRRSVVIAFSLLSARARSQYAVAPSPAFGTAAAAAATTASNMD